MATNKSKKIKIEEEATEEIASSTKKFTPKEPVEFKISDEGKKIIREFKEQLISNKKAFATISSYIFDVSRFIEYIESTGRTYTGEFSREEYIEFVKQQSELKFKINTINKRINSLQQFNIFLLTQKYMP